MIINEDPMASGAIGAPAVTVSPIVNTRKNVPMNSVRYLRMRKAPGNGGITRVRSRFYPATGTAQWRLLVPSPPVARRPLSVRLGVGHGAVPPKRCLGTLPSTENRRSSYRWNRTAYPPSVSAGHAAQWRPPDG